MHIIIKIPADAGIKKTVFHTLKGFEDGLILQKGRKSRAVSLTRRVMIVYRALVGESVKEIIYNITAQY